MPRGFGRGRGSGMGLGRGMGNPYPFCRFYPWLPRRWWMYGMSPYGVQPYSYQMPYRVPYGYSPATYGGYW